MTGIADYLTTPSTKLSPTEVLHSPPDVLLGVSAQAVTDLQKIEIKTTFDLATSKVFANAALLVEASNNPHAVLARYGLAPSDVLDSLPPGITVDQLAMQPIDILAGVGVAHAAALSTALLTPTVRDLALWPPYVAAKAIFNAVFFPDALPGSDPDAPADLLPKSGEYPTERVFYSTLVFDGFDGDPGQLIALEGAGQVDVTPAAGPNFGFTRPAIGALLTMSQSWYAQGVALGQLLHSVALAPGESTRIAMLDWSRREAGKQTENTTETESLSNITEHSRALSEVTSAVAQEAQSGFSKTHVNASSQQAGGGLGIGIGPLTLGESNAGASSSSDAMSYSSSAGRRDLSASMTQNVVDRTQQYANAARNRRATVVREVSQSEHEQVSTRVVTNYNHMHALSVQYYEVVQVYRSTVQLVRVERCLFVPMRLIDFNNPDMVRLFRDVLLRAAIDADAKALIATNYDTVDVQSVGQSALSLQNATLVPTGSKNGGMVVSVPNDARIVSFYLMPEGVPAGGDPAVAGVSVNFSMRDGSVPSIDRPGPQDVKVRDNIAVHEVASIAMSNPKPAEYHIIVAVGLVYKGVPFGINFLVKLPAGAGATTVLDFVGGGIRADLINHLQAHRLYYSQAVFRALDPATVTLLLAGYSYRGRPVTALVDPQPVTTAGNYLVFKTHVTPDNEAQDDEQREWAQWLQDHGVDMDHVKEDLVPLPSGGVFAEAVLGRYNAAEKLDITRFWNWQDSPIPILPPDISPVKMDSLATPTDLKASPFSQPLVNIVSPTSLPDPTGLGATLQAISNGNMFRDMSGLAATIGLAQAGLQTTSEAATAAGVQAGSNLATAAKKEVEMFKAALAFAGAVMGAGSTDTSPSTISNDGAKINHGRSLDARGASAGGSGNSGGAGSSLGNAGGGKGGAGGVNQIPGGSAASQGGGASNEAAAFQRAVWGSSGGSQQDLMNGLLGSGDEVVPANVGATIPAGGLTININTAQDELDLGFIRMTKAHLFVEADIDSQPKTKDADKPSGYGLTPLTGQGGAGDRPPQPGQSGKIGKSNMRWFNLGPGTTYKWRFWRGLSPSGDGGAPPPVRSSLIGTLKFTESDTWPAE